MSDLLGRIDGLGETLSRCIFDFAGPLSQYLLGRGAWTSSFFVLHSQMEAVYADAYAMDWEGDLATLPGRGPSRERDRVSRSFEHIRTLGMYERYQAIVGGAVLSTCGFRDGYDTNGCRDDVPFDIPPNSLDDVGLRNCWDFAVTPFLDRPIALAHAAAYNGHAALLYKLGSDCGVDLARLRDAPDGKTLLFDHAASRGYLDVLKCLHAAGNKHCTTRAMDSAITNGNLEIVQWLHAARDEGCSPDGFDTAYQKWEDGPDRAAIFALLEAACGYGGFTDEALVIAARTGDVRFLKAVTDTNAEGVPVNALCRSVENLVKAMTEVARYGPMESMEVLHALLPIGAAGTEPMDAALLHCNRAAIRFLLTHRPSEGCSVRGFEDALDVFDMNEFLEPFMTAQPEIIPVIVECFASLGEEDAVMDLYEGDEIVRNPNVMAWAAHHGKLDWMRKLHEVYNESYTDAATDRAAGQGHFTIVQFLLEAGAKSDTLALLVAHDTTKHKCNLAIARALVGGEYTAAAEAIYEAAACTGDLYTEWGQYAHLVDPNRDDLRPAFSGWRDTECGGGYSSGDSDY
ncbi:hypothetical protein SPRG_01536 [Saprolegnia parasitica CBS 223.65]|uniref:Uncharacterized protein n=1 Tax=Saprolegnia parasitica (strain CBS 223.65) TaxID=695850 RepID=A0A067CYR1_SAPPC|nr:hypothetical protein SPRG_01536 [Saprolegnia parasitica CBS 223.65]KDO34400.1 hypothetical protein SPRG_01536 [Saprolegnia parasitica CBS 223.65]|eukprot:XP_012195135.1 hypothetical protein SPRG_01536 [Saprolegnia parasitica CBS 223.65]